MKYLAANSWQLKSSQNKSRNHFSPDVSQIWTLGRGWLALLRGALGSKIGIFRASGREMSSHHAARLKCNLWTNWLVISLHKYQWHHLCAWKAKFCIDLLFWLEKRLAIQSTVIKGSNSEQQCLILWQTLGLSKRQYRSELVPKINVSHTIAKVTQSSHFKVIIQLKMLPLAKHYATKLAFLLKWPL